MTSIDTLVSQLSDLGRDPVSLPSDGLEVALARGRVIRRRRRMGRFSAFGAAIAAVLAVGVSIVGSGAGDGVDHRPADQVPQGASTTTVPDEPDDTADGGVDPAVLFEAQAALDRLDEQWAAGWIPWGPDPALPGIVVPMELFLSTDADLATMGEGTALPGAMPLHDAPDGAIIGFHIPSLGYWPADRAAEIDEVDERIALFGCDPLGLDGEARVACTNAIEARE